MTPDIVRRVGAATVMVRIEYDAPFDDRVSWGAGFVIGDGLIMTNAHVVSDNVPKRIFVSNASLPATEARVLASRYDPDRGGGTGATYYDVAVLSFSSPHADRLPVLPFALNAAPRQSVFAFGYPGSEMHYFPQSGNSAGAPVITAGVIDQIVRSEPNLLMHSALARNGNSGGPLVNSRGEVVGMQTWSADPEYHTEIESFAIGSGGLAAFMQGLGLRPRIAR